MTATETDFIKPRGKTGSRNNRRLRADGWIPGVLYGPGGDNLNLAIKERTLARMISHGVRAFDTMLDGQTHKVLLKEVQYGSWGDNITHVDLMRLEVGARVQVKVQMELIGEAAGQKEGGVLTLHHQEIVLDCSPENIPEKIEVMVANLGFDEEWKIGDVKLPAGVSLADPEDSGKVLVSCKEVRVKEEAVAGDFEEQPEMLAERQAEESTDE